MQSDREMGARRGAPSTELSTASVDKETPKAVLRRPAEPGLYDRGCIPLEVGEICRYTRAPFKPVAAAAMLRRVTRIRTEAQLAKTTFFVGGLRSDVRSKRRR